MCEVCAMWGPIGLHSCAMGACGRGARGVAHEVCIVGAWKVDCLRRGEHGAHHNNNLMRILCNL